MNASPWLRRASVTIADLPTEASALEATLALMDRHALEGARDPLVAAWAVRAVSGCRKDARCSAARLLEAVRRLAWTPDPKGLERVANARWTLEVGGGDCDDLAVLFAAGAVAVGQRVAWILGSTWANTVPSHVLPAVAVAPDRWFPAEVSSRTIPTGRLDPRMQVMRVRPVRGFP